MKTKKKDLIGFKQEGGLQTIKSHKPDDIFITCASFEPRTVSAVKSFSPEYKAKLGLVYVNKELLQSNPPSKTKEYLDQLQTILKRHCSTVELLEGSWVDAATQVRVIRDSSIFKKPVPNKDVNITLDTTTFTRETLSTIILMLHTHYLAARLRAIYISPEDHGKWLSRGFRHVRNVMGFAGIQRSNRPTLLVALSGFEPERTAKIIQEHEPNKVLLGMGMPPTTKKFLERNKNEQKLILARQDVEQFPFPAGSIANCWKALEDIIRPYLDTHNIVLAPMCTKLSTIGAILLAENHPEIQITYCLPGEYNLQHYSSGASTIYIEEVPRANVPVMACL